MQFVHIKSIFAPTFLNKQWSNPLVERLYPATTENMNDGVFLLLTCANARILVEGLCRWQRFHQATMGYVLRVKSCGPERGVCVRIHVTADCPDFSIFTFPWDILTCQHSAPRYRTTEQFYLSECSGKSIPMNIGKPLCRPVSPTQGKSHFEKMVTRAINHSSASQRPITFSSLN